ncbi:hypothetical protein D3C81_578460 [compost metagenome]
MRQTREYQPLGSAPTALGRGVGLEAQAEAPTAAELDMAGIIDHVEGLAVAFMEQAVHADPVQQGTLRAAGIVLSRRLRAQQQMAAGIHPIQQGLRSARRHVGGVLQQHQRIGGGQWHLCQVQPLPGLHLDAVGAQGLAQHIQRVVAGFALWRQHDGLGHLFVRAQEQDRQRYPEQDQRAQQQ